MFKFVRMENQHCRWFTFMAYIRYTIQTMMLMIDSYSAANGMIKVNFLSNQQVKINARCEKFTVNGLWARLVMARFYA